MSTTFAHNKGDLLFVPLGGSAEIGMNFNLYHLDGKWLVLDCGAGFAEDFMPGIDMLVPDIRFISERKKDLLGIVLTHAHEDHLGAVQYLWQELGCKVYATPFTAAFLRAKLSEFGLKGVVPIQEVPCGGSFELGPFSLEMVQITHSVPEMQGIVLRTKQGTVLHTGDWKLDPNPVVGPTTDEVKLAALGKEGVLAMVCDSTNIFKEEHSGSEGDLQTSLMTLVRNASKLVVVTTFASNIARIETVARAAAASGRSLVMAGRSLWRIYQAARESGYLLDIPEILPDHQLTKLPREKTILLCTGCQGEPLAAMNKIAHGTHPQIRLAQGDTVIFSSKIIPGNDKRIFRLFNKLILQGVEVLTERDHFVHVSGHPSRQELAHMYGLVRPKIAIPVHGEHVHMHEHARFAKGLGVENAFQVKNGDVLRLAPGAAGIIGKVPCGFFGIDGNLLLGPDCTILKQRRRMQKEGLVVVSLVMNKEKPGLRLPPQVLAPGALDPVEDADILSAISMEIKNALDGKQPKSSRGGETTLVNVVRAAVKRIMRNEIGKEPLVEVLIERV
jgi:ribonuclease J